MNSSQTSWIDNFLYSFETLLADAPNLAATLRHYRFPFPPENEQNTIAVILDEKTGEIDALNLETGFLPTHFAPRIQLQKTRFLTKGIERLQACRTVLISAAVTRKIDVHEEGASRKS